MKKILIPFFLLLTTVLQAQLNNSWIDYSKTYYKFRLGTTGLCRINQSTLAAAGLGSVPAEQFQLWRNGQQVPIYTSVPTGAFGSNDYIEFLGKANDGKPDKNLYLDTSYQLSDDFSLFTDTAVYFLTTDPVTADNLHYANTSNIIPANPPTPDAYFMNRVEGPYDSQINRGSAVNVGEAVYSASYDMGEGWTSNGIGQCSSCDLIKQFNSLNVYTGPPANNISIYVSAFGNISANYDKRDFRVKLFNTIISDDTIIGYSILKKTITKPLSTLTNTSIDFATLYMGIYNSNDPANDQAVVAKVTLTYPATFNFNNKKNFYFELASSRCV